nr:tumor necrosis factor receptor superfamily member 13C [Labrus bergylta]XP_020513551.1 tumor necrosis factor receptor superfamily member 13C [Labrus bergylta]
MAKKDCPVGEKWDLLVKHCISSRTINRPKPTEWPTEPPLPPVVQVKSTSPAPQLSSMMFLSPALWICVGLGTVVTILIVTLFFIYRKHTRTSRTPDDSEKQREPVVLPSQPPCSAHLHPGAQTGWEWEEDFTTCRCPPMHAGTRVERGLEHRVPLPATELGGTVLVTTKTV